MELNTLIIYSVGIVSSGLLVIVIFSYFAYKIKGPAYRRDYNNRY